MPILGGLGLISSGHAGTRGARLYPALVCRPRSSSASNSARIHSSQRWALLWVRSWANRGKTRCRPRLRSVFHTDCKFRDRSFTPRPSYQEYLSRDALSADFCFPLQMGSHWGNRDVPWSVEPARAAVASFLPAEYAGAIHIFSNHFGSSGRADVWFQKGIGVVGEHYIHNGTYDEHTKKLVSFTP